MHKCHCYWQNQQSYHLDIWSYTAVILHNIIMLYMTEPGHKCLFSHVMDWPRVHCIPNVSSNDHWSVFTSPLSTLHRYVGTDNRWMEGSLLVFLITSDTFL